MNPSRIAAVLLTILSATACVAAEPGDIEYPVVDESAPPVVVTADPPPPPVEVVPVVAPVDGRVWVRGYWWWGPRGYVWAPGRYVVGRPGAVWVGPRFEYRGGVRYYYGPRWIRRR